MDRWKPSPELEDRIKDAFDIPNARPEFINDLKLKLERMSDSGHTCRIQEKKWQPARMITFILLATVLLITLIIGPQKVIAAIGRLFGYIPNVGLVDESQNFRVLSKPVSQTRDGITITVSNALLTEEKTVVLFSVENLPWESLSHKEEDVGCVSTPELRLPNGSRLPIRQGGGSIVAYRFEFEPISNDINEAVFALPCILDTLPGVAPGNWELPLKFIPAPQGLELLPVFEVPIPTAEKVEVQKSFAQPLSLLQALDIGDSYVLFVEFNPTTLQESMDAKGHWQLVEPPALINEKGEEVFYQVPTDLDIPAPTTSQAQVHVFQFSKNAAATLDIVFATNYVNQIGLPREFTFTLDVGSHPSPGQSWEINLPLIIDGYQTTLNSVVAGDNGYSFNFDHGQSSNLFKADAFSVEIEEISIDGHTPIGGGGGIYGEDDHAFSSQSVAYQVIPTGKLNVTLKTQLYQSSRLQSYRLHWTPPSIQDALFGIKPVVDRWLEDNEGYILIGHNEWTDNKIANATEYGDMQAIDAKGIAHAIDKLTFAQAVTLIENLQGHQWAYRLSGKDIHWPVTLCLNKVNVEFVEPIRMKIDLRSYGFTFADEQVGLTWKTGIQPLDIPGISTSLISVKYLREDDYAGFEFNLLRDPALVNLAIDLEAGVDGESGPRKHTAVIDPANGILRVGVMTNGKLSMPLSLVAYGADISDSWESTWEPLTP